MCVCAVSGSHGRVSHLLTNPSTVAAHCPGETVHAVCVCVCVCVGVHVCVGVTVFCVQVVLATMGTLTFAVVEWKHYKGPTQKSD